MTPSGCRKCKGPGSGVSVYSDVRQQVRRSHEEGAHDRACVPLDGYHFGGTVAGVPVFLRISTCRASAAAGGGGATKWKWWQVGVFSVQAPLCELSKAPASNGSAVREYRERQLEKRFSLP